MADPLGHLQDIAATGACGKAPSAGQNHLLVDRIDVAQRVRGRPDTLARGGCMTAQPTHFALPEQRRRKADAALIGADDAHFAAIAAAIERQRELLALRLQRARHTGVRLGQEALERDQEVQRTSRALRLLDRYGVDLCLGRMVPADGGRPIYLGRTGLSEDGEPLLIDWRAPAAAPYFAATAAEPLGLASRRRYRWALGRVVDYWDEVLDPGADTDGLAPDDESAFIVGLGGARTDRMRDVLATIRSDQDAIIRESAHGSLVVDGGPGTGKTVVALHRAAHLLYADPRLRRGSGGILVLGPTAGYLAYVADVLPNLGEDEVRLATIADLVPVGLAVGTEADPAIAALKADTRMVAAIEPAVALYEELPTGDQVLDTAIGDIRIAAADWVEAAATIEPGLSHNAAREPLGEALLDILIDSHAHLAAEPYAVRELLTRTPELTRAIDQVWPLLEPEDIVGDLWTVSAYLAACAPWLTRDQVRALRRAEPTAWTEADLPLVDAARARIGDPVAARREMRRRAVIRAGQDERDRVVDQLIADDDSDMRVMSMLRGEDLQSALVDDAALPAAAQSDPLAGPFAHVVVDEAQELTDAQWQAVLRRCPSRSLTVVGDRAQSRAGFDESWVQRLERIGLPGARVRGLTVNYRTPAEIMAVAEPVIRAVLPDANVPTSIRRTGQDVRVAALADRDRILDEWLAANQDGIACVIGDPSAPERPRVRSMSAAASKGLEFDLVLLAEPQAPGITGAVDRYVAMTRSTDALVVLQ